MAGRAPLRSLGNRWGTRAPTLTALALLLSSDTAFAGAGSTGGTVQTFNTVDLGTVVAITTVDAVISRDQTYSYSSVVFTGPELETLIDGFTVGEILAADYGAPDDGTLTWTLPAFGSSGAAAANAPGIDGAADFRPALYTITDFHGASGFGAADPVGDELLLDAPDDVEAVLDALGGVHAIAIVPGSATTVSSVSSMSTTQITLGSTTTTSLIMNGTEPETVIDTTTYVAEAIRVDWQVTGAAEASPPPDCSHARAGMMTPWPPDHDWVDETIEGVTAAVPESISVAITAIHQDEPTTGDGSGESCPDATIGEEGAAAVRSERDGSGDGRVYHIAFTATNADGQSCNGEVTVCVPHDRSRPSCIDEGALYDSTACP